MQTEINNAALHNLQQYDLPPGWRWVRLGEVCELIMGQSPPGSTYTDKPEGLPFFQGKADFGEYFPSVRIWCNQPIKIAEEGDILISVRAPVGPVNMNNLRCCIGRGLAVIRCRDEAINWYIFWCLRFNEAQIASLGSGSTFGAITRSDLIDFKIPLPPIEEQKRIAAKLQELMQEVERARTACEKQLEAAKALPAAYLRQVFESEEAKQWERRRLGEVCEVIMGQSPPGSTYNAEGKGLPFYQGKIEFGKMYLKPPSTWCTQPLKIAELNDILISVRAPVGPTNLCNIKCCIGRGLAALRPKNGTESLFLFYSLRLIEPEISSIGQGSTFSAVSKFQIQNIEIPFPAFSVQQHIASELKEKMAQVEKLRIGIEKQLEAINALPQAILRKAFQGEL